MPTNGQSCAAVKKGAYRALQMKKVAELSVSTLFDGAFDTIVEGSPHAPCCHGPQKPSMASSLRSSLRDH